MSDLRIHIDQISEGQPYRKRVALDAERRLTEWLLLPPETRGQGPLLPGLALATGQTPKLQRSLYALRPRDCVKLYRNGEALWLELTEVSGLLTGHVPNKDIGPANRDIRRGQEVTASRRNVFEILRFD